MSKESDQFQFWLMDMDDALERFMQSVPRQTAAALNSSAESLEILEGLILAQYATVAEAKAPEQAKRLDGYARYIGELFRRHFGGKWKIELDDPKNAFYRLPQIAGMRGQQVPLCPLTMVTTAVDRRTGKFLRTIFNNYQKKQVEG